MPPHTVAGPDPRIISALYATAGPREGDHLPNNGLPPLPGLVYMQLPSGGCSLRAGPRLLSEGPSGAEFRGRSDLKDEFATVNWLLNYTPERLRLVSLIDRRISFGQAYPSGEPISHDF